jgi:predicted RNA-binding Zn ribbon-like protein
MTSSSVKERTTRPEFIFVGEHPAVDFVNTLALSEGEPLENLRHWEDVVNWLSETGPVKAVDLMAPASRQAEALKSVIQLRQGWKAEMEKLVEGGKVSDDFIELLNHLLKADSFYERLHRSGRAGFHLERSASSLSGEKFALALLARQIAHFLAEANFSYLHRCANTESCVLYFYDTTKNHRRQWCSTATCGNRHKVAEFRKRQAKL